MAAFGSDDCGSWLEIKDMDIGETGALRLDSPRIAILSVTGGYPCSAARSVGRRIGVGWLRAGNEWATAPLVRATA